MSRRNGPAARWSISVRAKQSHASSGVATIGSPRTLNDVFTTIGQPVMRSNSEISR